jgi:hypothetical protein
VTHIERIKRRTRRLGIAKGSPNAWYYRMPWVLIAAAVMVLLLYVIALSGVVTFLYRHLIEAPMERLVTRRR